MVLNGCHCESEEQLSSSISDLYEYYYPPLVWDRDLLHGLRPQHKTALLFYGEYDMVMNKSLYRTEPLPL